MNKIYEMVFTIKGHIYPDKSSETEKLDIGKINCLKSEIDKANRRINIIGSYTAKVEAKDKSEAIQKARMCFSLGDFGIVKDIEITRVECAREYIPKEQSER